MAIRFINIVETSEHDPKFLPRTSAFGLCGNQMRGDVLRVVGNLPHGYEFKMASEADRDELIAWLEGLVF